MVNQAVQAVAIMDIPHIVLLTGLLSAQSKLAPFVLDAHGI